MLILHANAVVSSELSLGHNGLAIEGAVIEACGEFEALRRRYPQAEILDVRDCVVLPGLVNAHSHLELSDLKGRVPYGGNFGEWLGGVTQGRRDREIDLSETIANACRESLASGVTCVGDICFRHRAWRPLKEQPIRKTCFAEVFGITRNLSTPQGYLNRCIQETEPDELLRLGLSPHAPYTVNGKLYEMTAGLARQHGLPLSTHLAETEEEMEFLVQGSGSWLKYLKELGLWDGSFVCPGKRPVEYFLSLNFTGFDPAWVTPASSRDSRPFLLAHVNYINDDELRALAKTKHSVVYCPRSHRYFGHRPHRFREMLKAGINVCIGTDSLASNTTLSVLDEMRFLHRENPALPAETILAMGTINGARAVGWGDKVGVIQEGKEADLTAIRLAEPNHDPLVDILESEEEAKLTMVRGQIVVGPKTL